MIKVMSRVKIYEIDGSENNEESKEIKIHSHWNRNEMVDIELPGFKKLTVSANDLEAAIKNARNSSRY